MEAEIVLPITSPETEWVRGRALRKMCPKRDHGRVQALLAAALLPWAIGRGEVATEWRFRIEPPGEARRPVVPDVAFVDYERMRGFTLEDLQAPAFAPTGAFEILSPGDRRLDVEAKILDYLRSGSALVVIIDTALRSFVLHEPDEAPRKLLGRDVFCDAAALPNFILELEPFFARALDLPT